MQNLCKHRQYQQDVFPCPICEVRVVYCLSSFIIWVCVSHICDAHISIYYVQILFLAHILANICSNLIFELPSLPCISHILGLLDLKYVLHITEDEFRIALPHRQMWHRSSVSLLSYSVHILLSTTEPCLRDCQRTCRLGRDSSLPPQQSVCALICDPLGQLMLLESSRKWIPDAQNDIRCYRQSRGRYASQPSGRQLSL